MKNVAIVAISVAVALGGMYGLENYGSANSPDAALAAVKQVCDESRSVVSGIKEQECAELQDKTNSEYLCDGLEASSQCWVEAK